MQHLGGQHKLVHEEHKKRKVLQVATANGIIELDNPNTDDNGGVKVQQQPLGHDMAGLNCIDHNGPSNDVAKEMIYWKDIPTDSKYKSPIGQNDKKRKYLTFEPDGTFAMFCVCYCVSSDILLGDCICQSYIWCTILFHVMFC